MHFHSCMLGKSLVLPKAEEADGPQENDGQRPEEEVRAFLYLVTRWSIHCHTVEISGTGQNAALAPTLICPVTATSATGWGSSHF
jgi:hypothetical protein